MYPKLVGFGLRVYLVCVRLFDLKVLFSDDNGAGSFSGFLLGNQCLPNQSFEHIMVIKETTRDFLLDLNR